MKLLKIEKYWLIFTVVLFIIFNIPGVPPQGNVTGAILWCVGGMALSWIVHFTINARIFKIYKPRKTEAAFLTENAEIDRIANEEAMAELEADSAKQVQR